MSLFDAYSVLHIEKIQLRERLPLAFTLWTEDRQQDQHD